MKTKNILVNLAVGLATLIFGLAWFSVYQYLVNHSGDQNTQENVKENGVVVNQTDPKPTPLLISDEAFAALVDDASKQESENLTDSNEPNYTWHQKFLLNLDTEGYYESLKETSNSYADLQMEIWLGEYNEKLEKWIATPPNGFIEVSERIYKFNKFHYSNGRLVFSTEVRNGISYEFSGEYNLRKIPGGEHEMELLDGNLTKQKKGRSVEKNEVALIWSQGC